MCVDCAVEREGEKKGSSLWSRVKKVRRFLDEALKKTHHEATLDSDASMAYLDMGSCVKASRSPSVTSSVEALAYLPLFLLGASSPELKLPSNESETEEVKADMTSQRGKEMLFSDVFDAKTSIESLFFCKRRPTKEFIGPKLLSTIPLQLVVELSKLHSDPSDTLTLRSNLITNDCNSGNPTAPKIKRRSKVSCKRSLKRSRSSDDSLKIEELDSKCLKKKRVVFADDCGKNLEHIKTIENLDELDYESSDYEDYDHENEREILITSLRGMRSFIPINLPRLDLNRRQPKLDQQKVVLSDIKTYGTMIVGLVAVVNLGFQKEVTVRYTTDSWQSFYDSPSVHLPETKRLHFYDQFRFELHCKASEIVREVNFCVRFTCAFGEYWDNNGGKNYSLKLKK